MCGGRPCIRGYRLRVSDVLDMLADGATPEDIIADYEFLERADISACLHYASRQLDHSGGLDCLDRGCRWLSGFSAGYVSPFLALHAGKA